MSESLVPYLLDVTLQTLFSNLTYNHEKGIFLLCSFHPIQNIHFIGQGRENKILERIEWSNSTN